MEGLDENEDVSDLSMSERLAAEREMRKRDRDEMAATGRMRPGLLYGQPFSPTSFQFVIIIIIFSFNIQSDIPQNVYE